MTKRKAHGGHVRIGISGWTYPGWRGMFYPPSLPQRAEMDYAASRFHSIEINGSFYSLQRAASYRSWYERSPRDFLFAIKGSRYISHLKQLNEPEQPLANFFAQGLLELGSKLGPILWQFSPRFWFNPNSAASRPARDAGSPTGCSDLDLRFNPDKLEPFLALLPRTHADAAALAAEHDDRVIDPSIIARAPDRPIRYAIEVRHESFRVPEFFALLRKHDAALVVAGTAGKYPLIEELTCDFVYLRLHGSERMYAGSYSDAELDHWAGRIRQWVRGRRDVFVYFDNDEKTKAPFDARRLMERLRVVRGLPKPGTREAMPA